VKLPLTSNRIYLPSKAKRDTKRRRISDRLLVIYLTQKRKRRASGLSGRKILSTYVGWGTRNEEGEENWQEKVGPGGGVLKD